MQKEMFDIILMDIHMPEMDGLEAAQRIRRTLPRARQPHIVALSADTLQVPQLEQPSNKLQCHLAQPQPAAREPAELLPLTGCLNLARMLLLL